MELGSHFMTVFLANKDGEVNEDTSWRLIELGMHLVMRMSRL